MAEPRPLLPDRSGHTFAHIVFGLCAFLFALFLATQIGSQAVFFDNLALEKQPGLWPVVAITGMLVFGFCQLLQYLLHRNALARTGFASEVLVWLRALEFVAWFIVYVVAMPLIGYLPATLIFVMLLTLRLAYRSPRMIAAALLSALAIVVVFKSFLQVKIPGGMVYDYLPPGLRNFMILYF